MKRKAIIFLLVAILSVPTLLAPSIYAVADSTFPPVEEITDDDLREKTQSEKANAFVAAIHAKEDELGTLYRQWCLEGLAWITEMESVFGLNVFSEKYTLPSPSDLNRDDIVSIATREVSQAFGLPETSLHPFQVAFLRFSTASEPMWYVSFVEGGYVLLSRAGQPIEDPTQNKLLPDEQFKRHGAGLTVELAKEQYWDNDYMWPIETQANLYGRGIPNPDNISQSKAEEIALDALSEETTISRDIILRDYRTYFTYFVPSAFAKVDSWRIYFRASHNIYYQVLINAITGEVIDINGTDDAKG